MRYIFLIIVAISLSSCASNKKTYFDEFNKLDKQSNKFNLLKTTVNSKGVKGMAALDWLRNKVKYDGDPRYAYMYSILLKKTGVNDSSMSTLLGAMLTSRVDTSRCKNKKAALANIEWWENSDIFEKNISKFKELPLKKRDELITTALAVENASSTYRKSSYEWLCTGELKKVDIPNRIGNTYVASTPSKEDLLPYHKWANERRKIIKKFVENTSADSVASDIFAN